MKKMCGALLWVFGGLGVASVPLAAHDDRDGDRDRDRRGEFRLGGTAQVTEDPENPANEVIRIRTDVAPFFGTVSRRVDAKIQTLDNQLEFKSWFLAPKSCFGGAARLQLAIDLNGDGEPEGNAFGYFGTFPSFANCPTQTWLYEDLTGGDSITGAGPLASTGQLTPNEELEWDLTQFVCPAGVTPPGPPSDPCIAHPGFVTNWSNAETIIGAFPKHQVCSVALVDDSFLTPGPNIMSGTAYYDLFSAGDATWTNHRDGTKRGFAMGCGRDDDDDDDHDGDNDHDHRRTAKDDTFNRHRRQHWRLR